MYSRFAALRFALKLSHCTGPEHYSELALGILTNSREGLQ